MVDSQFWPDFRAKRPLRHVLITRQAHGRDERSDWLMRVGTIFAHARCHIFRRILAPKMINPIKYIRIKHNFGIGLSLQSLHIIV